jgi:hypothetical protein
MDAQVDVEVHAELSVGRSVCDFRSRPDKPANVHFATDAASRSSSGCSGTFSAEPPDLIRGARSG